MIISKLAAQNIAITAINVEKWAYSVDFETKTSLKTQKKNHFRL